MEEGDIILLNINKFITPQLAKQTTVHATEQDNSYTTIYLFVKM